MNYGCVSEFLEFSAFVGQTSKPSVRTHIKDVQSGSTVGTHNQDLVMTHGQSAQTASAAPPRVITMIQNIFNDSILFVLIFISI